MLNIRKSAFYLPLIIAVSLFFSYQNLADILFKDYVVQDDFRQSFFWIWQFWDKDLFPDFFFVEMYQSHLTRIPLLNLIYHLAPLVSPSPILFSKILSAIIGLLSSIAAYFMMLSLLLHNAQKTVETENKNFNPHFIAFSFSCCVSVMLWCTDYLSVAHSRSFIWLGLFLYLYLESEKKDLLKSLWIFILLLLSPICFLLCMGMQFFSCLLNVTSIFSKRVIKNINFYSLLFNSISVLVLYKIIFAGISTQGVGKEFSRVELEKLAEFNPGGRHPIFGTSMFQREWWSDGHWGLNIACFEISVIVWVFFIALAIYFLLVKPKPQTWINSPLSLLAYSSLLLYFTAQITFPLLFLPSRYIANSSFVLAISGLCLILREAFGFISSKLPGKINITNIGFAITAVTFTSIYSHFYHPRYVSIDPVLQAKILESSKNAVFAAHPKLSAINILSATAKRKVFINHEWSMAYTEESLKEIRRRNIENLKMIYATSREDFLEIAHREGITHILLSKKYYSPKYLKDPKYLEPYNKLLKDLIKQGESKGFFLEKYLK